MSEPGLGEPEMVQVRLVSLPVQVWSRAHEHGEELVREFTLIAASEPPDRAHEVPARLMSLVDQLTQDYAELNTDQEGTLARAAADGVAEVDLAYRVPPGAAQAVVDLGAMLDEADRYCRAGEHLLTLAAPAESLAFRRWYLDEFTRQIAGEPPLPWPRWIAAHPWS
ncbi:MAG: hypothetical protein ACRDY0_01440 [Acidimicrobiales bacterium]